MSNKTLVNETQDIIMQENLQMLSKLRLMDDDLMTMVFDKNIEATELLLNIILQRTDIKVLEVIVHKEYKNAMACGRSIIIDIYAKDSEDKIYDVEVQREDRGADPHRARFHSSMIDTKMLKISQKFTDIHDSYVIFITENDIIGEGLSLYHVERIIKETGKEFADGSHIIYVNGNYKNDDDPVGKLMHDFRCTSSDDMFYPVLANGVKHFKETEGGKEIMCKAVEELVERRVEERTKEIAERAEERVEERAEERAKEIAEERAKEIAEERAKEIAEERAKEIAEERAKEIAEERAKETAIEERKAMAKRMIKKGKFDIEEIAEYSELSIEEVEELAKM